MQRTYQLNETPATRVEGELAALLSREGRRLRVAARQVIQLHGDASDGFWLIDSGTVTLCRMDAEGGATVFAVLGGGDLFGELAHFAEVPRQVDALAESDGVLVRIDAALVDRLLASEPAFARLLLRSLANSCAARSIASTVTGLWPPTPASLARSSKWPGARGANWH